MKYIAHVEVCFEPYEFTEEIEADNEEDAKAVAQQMIEKLWDDNAFYKDLLGSLTYESIELLHVEEEDR